MKNCCICGVQYHCKFNNAWAGSGKCEYFKPSVNRFKDVGDFCVWFVHGECKCQDARVESIENLAYEELTKKR